MLILVLGGARSGKSRYAQHCATQSAREVYYLATATAGDEEMRQRIEQHKNDRPVHWHIIEETVQLASALKKHAAAERFLLVDCLTLWLNNVLFDPQGRLQETVFQQQAAALLAVLPKLAGDVLLVSNEVGSGGVAMDAVTRRFVDEAGRLHQQLAEICDRVILVTAGLPHILKP